MSLVRPNAKITVDGQSLTAAEAGLVRLRVRLGMGEAHDRAELFLWPSSKFAAARAGASFALALGPAGAETDVLTGEVDAARASADAVVIEAMAATIVLSRKFTGQTFLEMTVADIVSQLASEAGVDTDEIAGDLAFPAYTVDSRRSIWSHLNDLARLAGADLAATAAGALRFVVSGGGGGALGGAAAAAAGALGPGAGGPRYGASVLAWQSGSGAEPPVASIAAHGAASEAGAAKWHWLLREPAFTGDGPPRIPGALRTRDAADAVQSAAAARASRARVQGTIRMVGDATIRPGDTISVADLPSGDPGQLHVLAIEHVLDGFDGFTTTVTVEAA